MLLFCCDLFSICHAVGLAELPFVCVCGWPFSSGTPSQAQWELRHLASKTAACCEETETCLSSHAFLTGAFTTML